MIVLYILFLISLIKAQQVIITKTGTQQAAITKINGITTFWYNSSSIQVVTFTFYFCSIIPKYCNWYNPGRALRACMMPSYSDQIYIYWICGDQKIGTRLEGTWTGECALAKAIMPLHILTEDTPDKYTDPAPSHRRNGAAPSGSFDPHVYIDAIGVPRGVPDEFKARDQVKAGFESVFPILTVNKNVDWINYIYYNQ